IRFTTRGSETISKTDCFGFRDSYGSWKMRWRRLRRVLILMPSRPSVSRRRPRRIFDAPPAAAGAMITPRSIAKLADPQTLAQMPSASDGAFGRVAGHPVAATIGSRLKARIERSANPAGVRGDGRVGGNDAMTPMSNPHKRLAPMMRPAFTRAPGIAAATEARRPRARTNAAGAGPSQGGSWRG